MAYRDVETALAEQLRQIDGFDESNVTQGIYTILARGVGSALVLSYDRFSRNEFSMAGEARLDWYITVDMYVRYKDDAQIHADAASIRQAVIDRINQYPKLGGTVNVLDAVALEGRASPEMVTIGNIRFYHESISILAQEVQDYVPAE